VTAPRVPARRLDVTNRPAVLAGFFGIAIVVAALAAPVWHQLTIRPELRLVDLDVYRSAGTSLLRGRPVYAYLTDPPQLLPFTYPPIAAVFAIPLALLPWPAASWLWTIGQLVLLAGITAIAFRPLLRRFGPTALVALGLLVAAAGWLYPIRDSIRFGQVDIALVALCLLDCVVRRPRWPRGLLIGLAAAVKLTPAVFIPYLWLTGRRRAAVVAVATVVALDVSAALISPMNSRDYWGSALFESGRLGNNANTSNQSLRGMLLRSPLPNGVRTAVLVVCVVLVAMVGYRRARSLSLQGDEVAAVAVVGLLAVLLSPVAWIHHLAWIVLVLGVLAGEIRTKGQVFASTVVGVWYGLPLPWIGVHLLKTHYPLALGVPLRNAYGLGALVLLATLRPRRPVTGEQDVSGQQATGASPQPQLFVANAPVGR
jgi:alpha-1,2-mannosyltransferase